VPDDCACLTFNSSALPGGGQTTKVAVAPGTLTHNAISPTQLNWVTFPPSQLQCRIRSDQLLYGGALQTAYGWKVQLDIDGNPLPCEFNYSTPFYTVRQIIEVAPPDAPGPLGVGVCYWRASCSIAAGAYENVAFFRNDSSVCHVPPVGGWYLDHILNPSPVDCDSLLGGARYGSFNPGTFSLTLP
jgi:hypothetical protein